MKFFILGFFLLLQFVVHSNGNGNETRGGKLEDKDFDFRKQLDSPEHMRRKAIMSEELSFVAGIYRNTPDEYIAVCKAIILSRNEVLAYEDNCLNFLKKFLKEENHGGLIVLYKCHLRDQNNKATNEFTLIFAIVKKMIYSIDQGHDGFLLRITDPPEDCIIFTGSEALNGKLPPNSNYFWNTNDDNHAEL